MTKKEFIKSVGLRRFGLVEYIRDLESEGLSEKDIQVKLLKDEIVKSPRVLNDEWKTYEKVKQQVAWR